MSRIKDISSVEEWQEMVEKSDRAPFLILKHSARCSISTGALQAYSSYCSEQGEELTCCLVQVIENREVSNVIAESTGIAHASPQLHLIMGGKSVWHASHRNITRENILQSVSQFNLVSG